MPRASAIAVGPRSCAFILRTVAASMEARLSAGEHPPAGVCDHEANGLDCVAVAYQGISLCPHEPIPHKLKQFGREPSYKKWISVAALSRIGEHFERLALSMAHCEVNDTEYSTPAAIRTTP